MMCLHLSIEARDLSLIFVILVLEFFQDSVLFAFVIGEDIVYYISLSIQLEQVVQQVPYHVQLLLLSFALLLGGSSFCFH
jgi:hypothetical protein